MISVFDIFKIGIGPSSSHTVGPMVAARMFAVELGETIAPGKVDEIVVELFGSLGATGMGHGSDRAVMLGLSGYCPDTVTGDQLQQTLKTAREKSVLEVPTHGAIGFNPQTHIRFIPDSSLPLHPNGLRFVARCQGEDCLIREYYSIGGGFVLDPQSDTEEQSTQDTRQPYPFSNARELLQHCNEQQFNISDLMLENEKTLRSEAEIRSGIMAIWRAMNDCIEAGCLHHGVLPGGLKVERRAPSLHAKLTRRSAGDTPDPLSVIDWVNCYALAVSEENAAGGRVVTAPTNGAAGIIPAVLKYYVEFRPEAGEQGIVRFLLTAAAMAILYKKNASISGAEVGCQGEVGSACSMAAAALAEVQGGTPRQVENAAEIAMEHNLGLTCDPVRGLVQVPCIERNAIAAAKAINAARMANAGDGIHVVSLDEVIRTMWQTGEDMKTQYKETSQGGLAVNVVEC